MPSIRIIKIPAGEAPFLVRNAWVGTVLPLAKIPKQPEDWEEIGVLGGDPDPENSGGYRVNSNEAVRVLRERNATAADWWETKGFNTPNRVFIFGKKFCERIS